MDRKHKKKIDALNQRIAHLKQQVAGAKRQPDDPRELESLQKLLAAAEAELAKVKASQ